MGGDFFPFFGLGVGGWLVLDALVFCCVGGGEEITMLIDCLG